MSPGWGYSHCGLRCCQDPVSKNLVLCLLMNKGRLSSPRKLYYIVVRRKGWWGDRKIQISQQLWHLFLEELILCLREGSQEGTLFNFVLHSGVSNMQRIRRHFGMVPSCEGRVVCIAGPLGFGTPHCLERLHLSRDSLRFTGQFWGFKFYQCDCHNCRTCLGDSDAPFSWSMRNTSQVRLWSQHCGIKKKPSISASRPSGLPARIE